MIEKQQKTKFLNLFQISMPVTAIVSILHRISGLLLVLTLPIIIYVFYLSTQTKVHFDELISCFNSLPFRFILLGFVWVIAHHIFAGIRYLLIDIELGVSLPIARMSAWIANISAIFVTGIIAMVLLG